MKVMEVITSILYCNYNDNTATPNTRLQDDVGYKSLHVVHCMTHSMPY